MVGLPHRVGVGTQGIPSTLQSQTPSEPPPCPDACPQGQLPGSSGALPIQGYTLLFLWSRSKARPPLLLPPWGSPACGLISLLSHSHTAPCTQHHVSKQLTLPRELGGREPGGRKVGRSRKSSLGSGAEALPSPAARGLQAPRRVCAGRPWSSLLPTIRSLRIKNWAQALRREGKAEQGGPRAGGCLHRLGGWRCIHRQLLWAVWADPEDLSTRANPNLLGFRGWDI